MRKSKDLMKQYSVSQRDQEYLALLREGETKTGAFERIFPEKVQNLKNRDNVNRTAFRYHQRLMDKFAGENHNIDDMMQAMGLGNDRVFDELQKMLTAEQNVYFYGNKVSVDPDNKTRLRALELLARIKGLDKDNTVTVNINPASDSEIDFELEKLKNKLDNE